jgi:N,N'-diacetyllegionaminate synthase
MIEYPTHPGANQSLVWPRCFVIAEVAQAHDGSLGTAHAHIDAAANAGADAVKFQTHIAAAESTPSEPWRIRFSPQDATRYDYWRRMEFTEEQWAGLRKHAVERNLIFMSSPFSAAAAELLRRIGIQAWKIASGEVNNPQLIASVADSGLPVYVSTGMSRLEEVQRAVETLRLRAIAFTLLQCTSLYPCPPEKIGLNLIAEYQRRFECPVGLSDHSGTIFAGLAAATLGIAALEVHIILCRESFGPDVASSVTTAEFRELVDGIRFIERMRANPVDKDMLADELDQTRRIFRKSIVTTCELKPGEPIRPEWLTLKKPGTGLSAERLPDLIGRSVRRAVPEGAFLAEQDLA